MSFNDILRTAIDKYSKVGAAWELSELRKARRWLQFCGVDTSGLPAIGYETKTKRGQSRSHTPPSQ